MKRAVCWISHRLKRRWLIGLAGTAAAVVVGATTTYVSADPPGSSRLKVMTWNLDYKNESFDGWVDTIAKFKPEVAGLQEACTTDLEGIVKRLKERGLHYHVEHGQWTRKFQCNEPGGAAYGSAIISLYPMTQVNDERYKVVDGEGRGFTVATIDVARIGMIRVYVTHLGNSPHQRVQKAEVEQLISFQQADAKKNKPQGTVILGDFNAEPASNALDPIWSAGFSDVDPNCYKKEGKGCQPTHDEGKKLDYIFHKDLRVAERDISKTAHSDHHIWQMTITE
jgi:endonuclease/exonuclease/phosphatase family metal-dependent hydrolase